MKLKNFVLSKDLIGIEIGGDYFDFHNCFDYEGLEKTDEIVKLKWKRNKGEWVPADHPHQIRITVAGVRYLDIRGEPSDTIAEFGFFENSSLGMVDYNGAQMPSEGNEVFVIRFENGAEIALMASEAVASANDV